MTTAPTYPPLTAVLADENTRHKLGRDGLLLAAAHMWMGDCQTCGKPLFPADPPVLVASVYTAYVEMSLHHQSCRHPSWCDSIIVEFQGTKSYVYRPLMVNLPNIKAWPVEALLVNPSVERVRLVRDNDANDSNDSSPRWRLYRPIEKGFICLDKSVSLPENNPAGIHVREADGEDCVEVTVRGTLSWECEIGLIGMRKIRTSGGVLVLVSNLINPGSLNDYQSIESFLQYALQHTLLDAAWAPLAS